MGLTFVAVNSVVPLDDIEEGVEEDAAKDVVENDGEADVLNSMVADVEAECKAAVLDASVRQPHRFRNRKCDCGEGNFPECPAEDNTCDEDNRYFRASDFAGKGCNCKRCLAAKVCRNVEGGQDRDASAWSEMRFGECECPVGKVIKGVGDECVGNGDEQRFYKAGRLVGKGCHCSVTGSGGDGDPSNPGGNNSDPDNSSEGSGPPTLEDVPIHYYIVGGVVAVIAIVAFCVLRRDPDEEEEEEEVPQ